MYQLVYVSEGKVRSRIALDADVCPGQTPQWSGRPLPFALPQEALAQGLRYLAREPMRPYQNKRLHTWIAHWIYADTCASRIFGTPLYCGIAALILELPFSICKDIRRRKELRYGRRLKGPILVSPRQFTNAVAGDGIGITTNDDSRPLRVPRNAENKHFLVVGETGSGKSTIIRQMRYQVSDTGATAIAYNPPHEFVMHLYPEPR